MQHKDIFIIQYLEKSKKALDDALFNLENNHLNAAQNRIY